MPGNYSRFSVGITCMYIAISHSNQQNITVSWYNVKNLTTLQMGWAGGDPEIITDCVLIPLHIRQRITRDREDKLSRTAFSHH